MDELLRLYQETTDSIYDRNLYDLAEPETVVNVETTTSRPSDANCHWPSTSYDNSGVDRPRSRTDGGDERDDESDVDNDVVVGGDLDLDSDNGAETDDDDSDGEVQVGGELQWTKSLSEVTVEKFEEDIGPQHSLPLGSEPIDFFHLLLPAEFFDKIAKETNLYAAQCQERKNVVDKGWREVTSGDVKVWVAINILFGIHQLPQYDMYWSSDDRFRVPGVADVMSKSRYEKISQYLHMNNNAEFIPRGQPGHDPLFKVRPLLDLVLEKIPQHFKPGQAVSIDEAMIPFTGRLSFKQYIRGKPNPWGIKAWCAADASTGYLLNFDIYTGETDQALPHGSGYHVVTSVAKHYLNRWHHFYFDNYFTSVKLAEDLLHQSTYCCGTIRPNRKLWPTTLKPCQTKKMKKGDVRSLQAGSMVATVWKDKRFVQILSTNSSAGMKTVNRNTPRETQIPTSVDTYNKGMGGLDLFDQLCSYYNFGRKSRKWWRYVFRFLLQVCIINSWIIFKDSFRPHPNGQKNLNQVFYRLDLVTALMRGNIRKGRHMQPQAPTTVGLTVFNPLQHDQIRMVGKKLACHHCSKTKKYNGKRGRAPETVFGCGLLEEIATN